jgi:hypothetical protein
VTGLRWSDDVLPIARAVLAVQRARLAVLGVPGELRLVGGSSVPGALTVGDVDLHLRVEAAAFAAAVARLREGYAVVHPEIWAPTLATFAVPATVPAGLAVTPIGSEHDLRFTRTWALLAADADLLAEHNAVKRGGSASGGDDEYERRKSAFFDRVVGLWDEHPAGARAHPAG